MGREARRRASLSGSGRLGVGRRLTLRLSGRSRFLESSLGSRHINRNQNKVLGLSELAAAIRRVYFNVLSTCLDVNFV